MYGTFTLTGRHTTPSGKAHVGSVVITPNTIIRDTAGDVILSGPEEVKLDATGAWSLALPCDSAGLNPASGIGYTVSYSLRSTRMDRQSFYATTDLAGTTLDESEIVTVSVPAPLSAIVGPAGADGAPGAPGVKGDPGDSFLTLDTDGTPRVLQSGARLVTEAAASTAYAAKSDVSAATGQLALASSTTRRRTGAYATRASDGMTVFSSTSGLTTSGSTTIATTAGTNGDAIVPLFAKQARMSFRVTCTKAIAGSRATVGVCVTSPGVMPGDPTTTFTFTFGYKAGAGLCWVRDKVGPEVVAVADSAITDGDQYDVTLFFDKDVSPRSGGTPSVAYLCARYRKVGTTTDGQTTQTLNATNFPAGNILVRTNVAAAGLSNLCTTIPVIGPLSDAVVPSASDLEYNAGLGGRDTVFVHMPPVPNGMAVIACHGHGDTYYSAGWSSTKHRAVWDALTRAGYTVFVPTMLGNLWGNDTALAALAALQKIAVDSFGLDPRVFLWGDSMGGGAALAAIGKGVIPVRAAYLTEPVCDLSLLWSNPSYSSMQVAYGNSAALRDANNPILLPTSAFTGVPIAFCASPDDTTVSKAAHTDAMVSKISGVTETVTFASSGAHAAVAAYRPVDPVTWFAAHI